MDTRAIIAGAVAITATICGTVTAVLTSDTTTTGALIALAGTSVAYAVGLLSEPHANTSNASPSDGATSDA